MALIRKHFNLTTQQIQQLEYLAREGTPVSEHVRLAIDEYLLKKGKEKMQARTSPSAGGIN